MCCPVVVNAHTSVWDWDEFGLDSLRDILVIIIIAIIISVEHGDGLGTTYGHKR